MRYDDNSGSFNSAAAGTPDARDDTDNLAAGSRSPATGNAISGEGTVTGAAGADIIGNAPGHIVALQGANGSDTADSGGSLQAAGRYGTLTMSQDGGYSYKTNGAAPENARDVFAYTLADQSGARDTAMLAIDIGHTPSVAENAQQLVPGPDGVVTLPPGVELSDVHVVGRNLVIDMPDGSQMVIIDGAVFVPQLVLNGVEVPSSNLAALLIDSEPKPAAGTPQSGGGNFAVDVGPLDPGVPLGDLIPPTELAFPPTEPEEVIQPTDDEPELIIIPDGQPGAVNAVDSVDESGLPERDGEPEGTLEPQNIETTAGVISIDAEDGIDGVTINGVDIDSVGDTVVTARGILTITSIDLDSGEIGYSYTATDNTTDGVDDFDDFTVVVTDDDGDTATGTLHIDILDDEPIARNDTDSVTEQNPTAVGNVMTAVGTTNSPAGVDTVGADDASLTAVQGVGPADTTFDINGNLVVQGQFGTLTIDAEGNYTYVRDEGTLAGGNDVFTYTLTDGDGDVDTATLTITVPTLENPNEPPVVAADSVNVSEEGLIPDGNPDGSGTPDTTDSPSATGDVIVSDPDGDATTAQLGEPSDSLFSDGTEIDWDVSPDGHTLTGTANGNTIITVTINDDGEYEVVLSGPVDHPDDSIEDAVDFAIPVTVSDGTVDVPTTINVTIEDDSPTNLVVRGNVDFTVVTDETGPGGAATIAINDGTTSYVAGNDPDVGEPGPIAIGTSAGVGAAVVSVAFGADGPQGLTGLTYELSILNSDSGLTTTEGTAINLVQLDTGEIVGIVDGTDTVAFAISIDGDTGAVRVEQYLSLFNPDATDPDDPIAFDEGVLGVTVTATDNDGDHITSDAVDVGENVTFEDDGPSNVTGDVNSEFEVVTDETGPGGAPLIAINDGTTSYVAGDDSDVASDGPIAIGTSSVGAITGADAEFGADGPAAQGSLTYALSILALGGASGLTTTDGTAINLVQLETGEVLGIVDGTDTVAFAIAIDADSGEVRVEQYLSLFNPDATDPDDPIAFDGGVIGVTVTATDGDGDSITGDAIDIGANLTFEDDGPTEAGGDVNPEFEIVTDETGPGGAATIALADGTNSYTAGNDPDVADTGPIAIGTSSGGSPIVDPTALFGADGPAADSPFSYGLSILALDGDSGLDTTEGDDIMLVQLETGEVLGIVDGTDTVAFAIEIDPATGEVRIEQYLSIYNPDATDPDDPVTLDGGILGVTVTATDGDGDPITSDAVDIGGNVTFEDDGPTEVDGDINPDFAVVTDESGPGGAATIAINDTLTSYVAGNDPDVTNAGPIAIGTSGGEGAIVDPTALFGADGPAADSEFSYGLSILSDGGASGLTTTEGDAINLVQLDTGEVLGIVDGTDTVAFAIEIDPETGEVRVEQYLSLFNPDATDPDDPIAFDEGVLGVTVTATDGDGDSITSDAIDVGEHVTFEDDGPSSGEPSGTPPTITLDESPPPTAGDGDSSNSANFASLFASVSAGADGPDGDPAYSLLLTPDSEGGDIGSGLYALDNTDVDPGTELGSDGDGYGQGDEILLVQIDANTIEGQLNGTTYFTIDVDAATGEVTFSQQENIWHDDVTDPDDSETLTASGGTLEIVQTITDGDGDTADATVDLSSGVFIIEDDGPSDIEPEAVDIEQGGSVTGSLDLVGPGSDAAGVDDNYGTDGEGTVRFPTSLEGAPAEDKDGNPLTSGGAAILYHVSTDGLTLYGYVDDGSTTGFQSDEDTTVFTIVLDPGSSEYTVTLEEQIDSNTEINFNDGSYDFVGGNDPWAAFVDPDTANSQDLLLTPFSDTGEGNAINGNANSAGVTGGGGGQNIGTGEGIRLDYVIDITGNPAGSPANYDGNVAQQDHLFGDHYGVNDASARFGDGQDPSTISIKAFDANDATNLVYHNGTLVSITEIVIQFDGESQVVTFDPLDLSQTVTVGIVDGIADRNYTVEWVESGGKYYVEVTGILDVATKISVHGETDYEALEIQHLDGDDFAITGFGVVTQSTDPVPFTVPVEIVDADGDTADGTLDVTVYAVGDLPEADAFSSLSLAKTSSIESQSLLTEDSSKSHGRSFDAANNNSVLLGAIAAAGLASAPAAAKDGGSGEESDGWQLASLSVDSGSVEGSDAETQASHALTGEMQEAADDGADRRGGNQGHSNDNEGDHSVTDGGAHETQAPSELLAGTDTPQSDAPAQSSFTSPGVAMPTAEMLAAATAEGSSEGEAKSSAVVEQVLTDALAGGGDGTNIDAVIDAIANQNGGAKSASEGLASQGHDGGSHWDTAGLGHFPGAHTPFTMEAIQLHHDAVQPAV